MCCKPEIIYDVVSFIAILQAIGNQAMDVEVVAPICPSNDSLILLTLSFLVLLI